MRAWFLIVVTALVGWRVGSADAETETRSTSLDTLDSGSDGSVSCGRANRGSLANAAVMPSKGHGFVIVEPWLSRELHYGTDELVSVVQRAAGAVADAHPGSMLSVGDLSDPDGGPVPGHRSHQSGRDIDLVYYALDESGKPMEPDSHMAYYRRSGRADFARSPKRARDIPVRYFDAARNWELVKSLVTDDEVMVHHIFVSWRIRTWLLEYAEAAGESDELLTAVRKVLIKPSSGGHNDHMHVRIGCSAEDEELGRCRNKNARSSRGSKWRRHVPCPAAPEAQPRS